MGHAAARTPLSADEYLAFERVSAERHEFADGEIFAMSGGTAEHSAIALNLLSELRVALRGRPCRAFEANMRVHVPASGRYVYPDGSVVCGRPEFTDATRDTLTNPRVVIEVLSSSTEAYDRGETFAAYRSLPSLADYVLASQTRPQLEVFTRGAGGGWMLRVYGPGEAVELASIGCTVEVDRVYEGVFDPGDAA